MEDQVIKKSKNETFQNYIDDLHHYLDDMEDDFNTYGLHTLGKILTGYELAEEVVTIVTSQTKIYDQLVEFMYPKFELVFRTHVCKYLHPTGNSMIISHIELNAAVAFTSYLHRIVFNLKIDAYAK